MNRRVAVFFSMVVLLNLIYNALLPLHFDEAYYWVWSKHLQLSYFDHPPMIAWLIRMVTFWADSEWIIRLVPLVCSSLTGLGIWRMAADLFDCKVADKALLLFALSPLAQLGFSLATPDAPLILGWTFGLLFAGRAIFGPNRRYYYLAGLAGGFALLSKYTAVLLLPGLFGFLIFSAYRSELRRKEPWLAIGLACLTFVPVIVWNSGHGWSSFLFQLNHGFAGQRTLNPQTFFEYLGVHAVGLGPVFFLLFLYLLFWHLRTILADEKQSFLLWPCLTVLFFFGYAALFKRAEGNWAAPAYVSGVVLLARWLKLPPYVRIYKIGIVMGVALTMLLKTPELFDFLPAKVVMKRQVLGYDELFQGAGAYLQPPRQVLAADYKLASLAWYYLPGQPEVQVLTPSRFSQYTYWRQGRIGPAGSDAIYFGYETELAALTELFEQVTPLPPLMYQGRYISRTIQVYDCRGFRPTAALWSSRPPFGLAPWPFR